MLLPRPNRFFRQFLLLLLTCFACLAKGQTHCVPLFYKEYRHNGFFQPEAIKYLPNGDLLVAGRDSISAANGYDAVVMRLSGNGNFIWGNSMGGAQYESLTGICPLSDGSFIVYGVIASFGQIDGKPMLVRIDAGGNLIWARQQAFTGSGKDRIHDMRQLADGNIAGILNSSDSSNASDAIVFKMTTLGTMLWLQRFDHGGADGFNTVAENGNSVVAAGYYTSGTTRRGVLVKVDAANGAVQSSTTVYRENNTVQEEVDGLEIFNNRISYALVSRQPNPNYPQHHLLLVQKDINGNAINSRLADASGDSNRIIIRRTTDNGFLLMRGRNYGGNPVGHKINNAGLSEWVFPLANYNGSNNVGRAFDLTGMDGYVFAGSYTRYENSLRQSGYFLRCNTNGESADCWPQGGGGISTDTGTVKEAAFTWAKQTATSYDVDQSISPAGSVFAPTQVLYCEKQVCTDVSPLPLACNKTFRTVYSGDRAVTLHDAVTTTDGGKLAVGDYGQWGTLVKTTPSGDVQWSTSFTEFGGNTIINRIISLTDGTSLVLGNYYYAVNHGASEEVMMLKIDNSGNVIWSRKMRHGYDTEIPDVCTLDDGGFIVVYNENYGFPPLYNDVIRYDAAGNIVWQKEIKHAIEEPVYRAVTSDGKSVYLGYSIYLYGPNHIGFDKLDLATGNRVWSKKFSLPDFAGTQLNRLFVLSDTLYAFVDADVQTGMFSTYNQFLLMKLTSAGVVTQVTGLDRGNLVNPNPYSRYINTYVPISVTQASNNDFVLTHRAVAGADTVLNVTRIHPDASLAWSINYKSLGKYDVYALKSEGKGFLLAGSIPQPHPNFSYFTNGYLLKLNDTGYISNNPSAECYPVKGSYASKNYNVTDISNRIDSIVPLRDWLVTPMIPTMSAVPVDADLVCNEPATCNTAVIGGQSNACSTADTVVYYLQNAVNCDMAVKWQYDTTLFRPLLVTGDTLKLLPIKPGGSLIKATITGSCYSQTRQLTASVLLSAANINLGRDTVLCPGSSIQLSAGKGFQSYLWNDGSTDSTLQASAPGKYYVTVMDNCGGSGTDTIMVNGPASLFHLTGASSKCNSDTILLTATPGFSNYQWSPQQQLIAQGNTAKVYPLQSTLYYASAQLWAGCTAKDSMLITALQSPALPLAKDTVVCNGSPVLLDAGAGFDQYLWNTGSKASAITVQQAGHYSVSALYHNGCSTNAGIDVQYFNPPQPVLGADKELCSGTAISLSPGVFSKYQWSDGSSAPIFQAQGVGQYWVKVTDQHGCSASDTMLVSKVWASPAGFLKDTAGICPGDELSFSPSRAFAQYNWVGGSNAKSLMVTKPGLYILKVTDDNGCQGSDTLLVSMKDYCPNTIYFPNAFTPNLNGRNEKFRPLVTGHIDHYEFSIFNRFGQRVFSSHQAGEGWDGKIGGQPQSDGGYVWTCTYQFVGEAVQFRKGTLILLR